MIALSMSHQTPQEVLGHYVGPNFTRFQNCRSDYKFVIDGKKTLRKHFDKNNMLKIFVMTFKQIMNCVLQVERLLDKLN